MIVFKGSTINAVYKYTGIPHYSDNPYIEALPPIETDVRSLFNKMARYPSYKEEERELPIAYKVHYVQSLSLFLEPLPAHFRLEQMFSRIIRMGYIGRNPMGKEWVEQINQGYEQKFANFKSFAPITQSSALGFGIYGLSGSGKTKAIESILSIYPQLIKHEEYKGIELARSQIVWLKLECPKGGTTKGLCINFFQSVDKILKETNYFEQYNKNTISGESLMPIMANVAFLHGIGVIVIDEIQRLDTARSGGKQEMLDFIVKLINTVGVPVVMAGTFKAMDFIQSTLSNVRRTIGFENGGVWSHFSFDSTWESFIKTIWKYQWTAKKTELTPEISRVLYEESAGIIDIAVKLYMLVQWKLISVEGIGKKQKITPKLIKVVSKEYLSLIKPYIEAIRKGENLKGVDDILSLKQEQIDKSIEKAIQDVLIKDQVAIKEGMKKVQVMSELEIEIFRWLKEMDIDYQIAEENAKKAVNELGSEKSRYELKMHALKLSTTVNQ
jgi:AAA domain